jgi:hypothetical protein
MEINQPNSVKPNMRGRKTMPWCIRGLAGSNLGLIIVYPVRLFVIFLIPPGKIPELYLGRSSSISRLVLFVSHPVFGAIYSEMLTTS